MKAGKVKYALMPVIDIIRGLRPDEWEPEDEESDLYVASRGLEVLAMLQMRRVSADELHEYLITAGFPKLCRNYIRSGICLALESGLSKYPMHDWESGVPLIESMSAGIRHCLKKLVDREYVDHESLLIHENHIFTNIYISCNTILHCDPCFDDRPAPGHFIRDLPRRVSVET
jgi:hypothetical protein